MRPCVPSTVPWPGPDFGLYQHQQQLPPPPQQHFYPFGSAWPVKKNMDDDEEGRRERRRRQRQQVVNCCKSLAAFLFSHIGLAAMVVAYSIMGGFLFQAIEAPAEHTEKVKMVECKEEKISNIIELFEKVAGHQVADMETFNDTLHRVFGEFQQEVVSAVKNLGWDGLDATDETTLQWSLAGAILYAVTVITTIGYGHIAPKTTTGRLVTILYALIGIPLTFLYLSNIGNFLADCFRLFYKKICCDIICCQKCERKRIQQRLKQRRRREMEEHRRRLLQHPSGWDDNAAFVYDNPMLGQGAEEENPGFEAEFSGYDRELEPPPSATPSSFDKATPSKSTLASESETGSTLSDHKSSESVDDDVSQSCSVRETAILSDASSSLVERQVPHSGNVRRNNSVLSSSGEIPRRRETRQVDPRRSPIYRRSGLIRLTDAKETDILKDSSSEGETQSFRNNPGLRSSPHFPSDPFLRVPSAFDEQNDRVAKKRDRTPVRSFTFNPPKVEPHLSPQWRRCKPENVRELTRTNNETKEKQVLVRRNNPENITKNPRNKKPNAEALRKQRENVERAKNHWKKVMAYTKQLAEKERERTGRETASAAAAASSKRQPLKKITKVGTTKNPTKNQHSSSITDATAGEKWQRLAQLAKLQRRFSADSCPPDRRGVGRRRPSDESFVTANNDSMASDEDGDIDRHELRRACSVRVQSRHDGDSGKQFDDNSAVDIGNQTMDDFQEVFIHGGGGDQTFSYVDDPFEYEEEDEHEGKVTVPISICLIIISGYLFAGASLFAIWENWDLITGSYFCFITLSTIGFGDIVPGTDMKEWASQAKLVLCSLWLAFGLSLLAMCFNLMQEEVKDKCKWIGQKLGLLKDEGQS